MHLGEVFLLCRISSHFPNVFSLTCAHTQVRTHSQMHVYTHLCIRTHTRTHTPPRGGGTASGLASGSALGCDSVAAGEMADTALRLAGRQECTERERHVRAPRSGCISCCTHRKPVHQGRGPGSWRTIPRAPGLLSAPWTCLRGWITGVDALWPSGRAHRGQAHRHEQSKPFPSSVLPEQPWP